MGSLFKKWGHFFVDFIGKNASDPVTPLFYTKKTFLYIKGLNMD